MKIIFSPSKEMRDRDILSLPSSPIFFKEKHSELLKMLQSFSKEEIAEIMKIKGKLLEETFENIRNFDSLKEISAFSLYNGVSFKNLELEKYDKSNVEYAENSLLILSAFYGVLQKRELLYIAGKSMTYKSLLGLIGFGIIDFYTRNLYMSCMFLVVLNIVFLITYVGRHAHKYVKFQYGLKKRESLTLIKRSWYTFAFTLIITLIKLMGFFVVFILFFSIFLSNRLTCFL